MPAEPVMAELDPERIGQVINNVLANAIKFTGEGGDVRVALHREAERVVLEVADTGIGIAAGDVDQLFERFFRARNATDRAIPGHGIGACDLQGNRRCTRWLDHRGQRDRPRNHHHDQSANHDHSPLGGQRRWNRRK